MKKMPIVLILILVLSTGFFYADIIKEFNDFTDPVSLQIVKDRVYIADGLQITILNKSDFNLITRFGKEGEGPGEFMRQPASSLHLYLAPSLEQILVSCRNKIVSFTPMGAFVKEKKVQIGTDYVPLRDGNYIGKQRYMGKKIYGWSANLYDKNLKMIKTLGKKDSWFSPEGPVNIVDDVSIRVFVSDQKIIVAGKTIDIFNLKGEKLKRVEYDFIPVKITKLHQEKVISWYRDSKRLQQLYAMIRDRVVFEKHFPNFKRVMVSGKKIFVQTYKKENKNTEFIIFDLEGRFQKKVLLPLVEQDIQTIYPYTFNGDHFYQLIENEDKEVWEMHRYKI